MLLAGGENGGKTTRAAELVAGLQQLGYLITGFLAKGLWQAGVRSGFDLWEVSSGRTAPLARRGLASDLMFGGYGFLPEAMQMGREALRPERVSAADLVIVDEVGRWELSGGGWAKELDSLLEIPPKSTILVVRSEFAFEVAARWGRQNPVQFDFREASAERLLSIWRT